jgi:hypothetical protein
VGNFRLLLIVLIGFLATGDPRVRGASGRGTAAANSLVELARHQLKGVGRSLQALERQQLASLSGAATFFGSSEK